VSDYEFFATQDGYTIAVYEPLVMIDASRIEWDNAQLIGEVTITTEQGSTGPLSIAFMKPTSRRDVQASVKGDEVGPVLQELCSRVVAAERTSSSPVVCLRDVERPSPDREYIVPVLPSLPRTTMSIWFGDGGTGKSLLALYTAGHLARQGVRVLYLDWEWDAAEHRERYEKLFGAAMPEGLWYWQCDRPLSQMSATIRQTIRKQKIDFVIVDSIAYACGGDAESSEVASRYKQHAHTFGVGSLHLAHVTKSSNNTDKPFGSAFWHNSARTTWYVQAEGEPSSKGDLTEIDLKLFHRKNNSGPKESSPRLIKLAVDKGRNTIQIKSRAITGRSRKAASTPDRIKAALVVRSMTWDELKLQIPDVRPDTLERTIRRGIREGWLTPDEEQLSLAS
jgi:AAA domain-containing protein